VNNVGELGNGRENEVSPTPTAVLVEPGGSPLDGVTRISAGPELNPHTCAVLEDGTARCWGNGPLGDGTESARSTPVAVLEAVDGSPLTGVTQIGAGGDHTCALVEGTIRCWGGNFGGQLGDGTDESRVTPVAIELG
jgi:alpha-tubulin suppressor-like RCC1 family protein